MFNRLLSMHWQTEFFHKLLPVLRGMVRLCEQPLFIETDKSCVISRRIMGTMNFKAVRTTFVNVKYNCAIIQYTKLYRLI